MGRAEETPREGERFRDRPSEDTRGRRSKRHPETETGRRRRVGEEGDLGPYCRTVWTGAPGEMEVSAEEKRAPSDAHTSL